MGCEANKRRKETNRHDTETLKDDCIQWVLLAIVAILANGCALTEDYVDIEYIPEAGVSKVDGADFVEVSVKLTDMRTTKDKVSCKKNGYGMEMAAIISNDDVTTLVANAIEDELRNRGFKITEGSVQVDIELNKFYNDFKVGSWTGSASIGSYYECESKATRRQYQLCKLYHWFAYRK
jgi:uncharacterized lipoprotein